MPTPSVPGALNVTTPTGTEIVSIATGGQASAQTTIATLANTALTADSLTAVGTNLATALALTARVNHVTTAAASTGVALPASSGLPNGAVVEVFNDGANTITVYGAGGDTIDGTAGATGVSLAATHRCQYQVIAAGKFLSALLGATSS